MNDKHEFLLNYNESMSRLLSGKPDQLQTNGEAIAYNQQDKSAQPPQDDNPLFDPYRYGDEFATSFYRIRDILRKTDPHHPVMLRLASTMNTLRLKGELQQWDRDLLLAICECALVGRSIFPPRPTAPKSRPHERQVQDLLKDWWPIFPTIEDARLAVEAHLELPVRPEAVKLLFDLVRPIAGTEPQARRWIADYLGVKDGRIRQLLKNDPQA